MEDKEIIRLFKGLAIEHSRLRHELLKDRWRINKLDRQMQKVLSGR